MLLRQTYTCWSCILVDDSSTDNGLPLLRSLVNGDSRFLITTNPESSKEPGPASARNHALGLVSTEYVAFCDIDDLWHKDKISLQISALRSLSLDICITAYCRFWHDQSFVPTQFTLPPSYITLRDLHHSNPIPFSSAIIKADIIQHKFEPIRHEDYYFWLCAFSAKPILKCHCLPYALTFIRRHNNNLTRNRLLMPLWTYTVFKRLKLSNYAAIVALSLWIKHHICRIITTCLTNHRLNPSLYPISSLMDLPPLRLIRALQS